MLQERIVHSMCKQLLRELTRTHTLTQLVIGSLAMDTRARTAAAAAAAAATAAATAAHSPGADADVHTDSHSTAISSTTTAATTTSRWNALRRRDSILDMFSSTGSEEPLNIDLTSTAAATASAASNGAGLSNGSVHFGSSSGHHRWPQLQLRKRTSEDSNAPNSPLSSPSHHNGTADTVALWGSKRAHDSSSSSAAVTTSAGAAAATTATSAGACAVDQLRTILDIVKRTVLVAVLQQGCVAAAAAASATASANADAAATGGCGSSIEQRQCRERAEQELRSVDEGGDAAIMSALLEQVRRAGERTWNSNTDMLNCVQDYMLQRVHVLTSTRVVGILIASTAAAAVVCCSGTLHAAYCSSTCTHNGW
jgi:trimeric autotransporter adhesin